MPSRLERGGNKNNTERRKKEEGKKGEKRISIRTNPIFLRSGGKKTGEGRVPICPLIP